LTRGPPPSEPSCRSVGSRSRARGAAVSPRNAAVAPGPHAEAFELFNHASLRERAARATAWRPDLTISIHYNMCSDGRESGLISFVVGNFLPASCGAGRSAPGLCGGPRGRSAAQYFVGAHHRPTLARAPAAAGDRRAGAGHGLLPTGLAIDAELGCLRETWRSCGAPRAAVLVEGPCMNDRSSISSWRRRWPTSTVSACRSGFRNGGGLAAAIEDFVSGAPVQRARNCLGKARSTCSSTCSGLSLVLSTTTSKPLVSAMSTPYSFSRR